MGFGDFTFIFNSACFVASKSYSRNEFYLLDGAFQHILKLKISKYSSIFWLASWVLSSTVPRTAIPTRVLTGAPSGMLEDSPEVYSYPPCVLLYRNWLASSLQYLPQQPPCKPRRRLRPSVKRVAVGAHLLRNVIFWALPPPSSSPYILPDLLFYLFGSHRQPLVVAEPQSLFKGKNDSCRCIYRKALRCHM